MTRSYRSPVTSALAAVVFVLAASLSGEDPASETAPPVRMADVKSGTLLFRTEAPGVFLPAPALDTDVRIRVSGIVARAEVSQRFRNGTGICAEAVYVFPLPEGAAVDRLRMTIGGRVIEGEIREREEAKKVYEQAKAEGRKATLLEQERPNVFTASVASIGPDEEVQVSIEYQETVRLDHGRFGLRFPTVVGTRYVPGKPVLAAGPAASGWALATDSVPDAGRITPPVLPPGSARANPIHLAVEIDAGVPLRRVESGTHPIRTETAGPSAYRVLLADAGHVADRDFELSWEPDMGQEPLAAAFTQELDGCTYALLMVLPPDASPSPATRLPRETVYVIDTSGSMHGPSIEGAKAAIQLALSRLAPEDRFNVIEFNSQTALLFSESRPATSPNLEEAKRWVEALQARGGTEMLPALTAAFQGTSEASSVRQVLFMTDGAVGNEDQLFEFIRTHLGSSRLFTVGMGSAPNAHFLTKAAQFGRGTFTFIATPAEVGSKMAELFQKLESPVVTDVEVRWDDAGAEAWPQRVPDLYAGEPIVIAARLTRGGGGVTVSGQRVDREWSQRILLSEPRGNSGVDALWARRKIAALMDSVSEGTDRASVRARVVEVALAHHLVSEFTSLVAVDVTPTISRGTACESRPIPVHLPAGWSYEHVFGSMPRTGTAGRLLLAAGLAILALGLALRARTGGPL